MNMKSMRPFAAFLATFSLNACGQQPTTPQVSEGGTDHIRCYTSPTETYYSADNANVTLDYDTWIVLRKGATNYEVVSGNCVVNGPTTPSP